MKRSFVYAVLALLILVSIVAGFDGSTQWLMGMFSGVFVVASILAGCVGLFWVGSRLSGYRRKRRYQQKLGELLQGEPLREALAASGYTISHAQGESGYQIASFDSPAIPIVTGLRYEEATIWVLAQRQRSTRGNPTPVDPGQKELNG